MAPRENEMSPRVQTQRPRLEINTTNEFELYLQIILALVRNNTQLDMSRVMQRGTLYGVEDIDINTLSFIFYSTILAISANQELDNSQKRERLNSIYDCLCGERDFIINQIEDQGTYLCGLII